LESGNEKELAISKDALIHRFNSFLNEKCQLLQESLPDLTWLGFGALNQTSAISSIQKFGFIDTNTCKASPFHSSVSDLLTGF